MTTLRALVILTRSLVIVTIAFAGAAVVESVFTETAPLLSRLCKQLPSRESDRAVARTCCIIRSTP
jgi:hypothetical protein